MPRDLARSAADLEDGATAAALREAKTQAEAASAELEAFSYSVAHDLRAPLRAIDGFSEALLQDYADKIDAEGQKHLRSVRKAAQRMATLIDDLLTLSRSSRGELRREKTQVSVLAQSIVDHLRRGSPARDVDVLIEDGLTALADQRLLTVVLDNLIGNAWKFTSKTPSARIEIGSFPARPGSAAGFFVRDNGAGFDMTYVGKLFTPFQRLHTLAEYEGTGIGLATVERIVRRHGGRAWADGEVDGGATVYFTLAADET